MIDIPKPEQRNLYLCSDVYSESAKEIYEKIHKINDSDFEISELCGIQNMSYNPQPINLYIDSYGGETYKEFGLVSAIQTSKTPVYTICMGSAMSAAFIIFLAGMKRFCYKYSIFMHHYVITGLIGQEPDVKNTFEEIKMLNDNVDELILNTTDIKKSTLHKIRNNKTDWFINAKEAKQLNIVSEIIY